MKIDLKKKYAHTPQDTLEIYSNGTNRPNRPSYTVSKPNQETQEVVSLSFAVDCQRAIREMLNHAEMIGQLTGQGMEPKLRAFCEKLAAL